MVILATSSTVFGAVSFARLIKRSYLAPDIVTMVLEGRQPSALNRKRLMGVELPLRWADQRVLLGCA